MQTIDYSLGFKQALFLLEYTNTKQKDRKYLKASLKGFLLDFHQTASDAV